MQNIAEFHIIGRIGKIDAAKDVTHISVAARTTTAAMATNGSPIPIGTASPCSASCATGSPRLPPATWCGSPGASARPATKPMAQPATALT